MSAKTILSIKPKIGIIIVLRYALIFNIKEKNDMLEQLDNLFEMLLEIENKLTDLERINSMVIVTCDACENGNDIKYDVSNVMMLIEDQIDMVEETIRSNVSKCNALTRNIQETIKKGDCQYERTTNI